MDRKIFRAIIAILTGLILVIYPQMALSLIIYALGAMLIISSAASVIDYGKRKTASYTPPLSIMIGSVVSLLVGVILVLSPLFFVSFLLTLLSLLLLLGAIWQIGILLQFKRSGVIVSLYRFIIPVILFLLGVSMIAAPIDSAKTITTMFGYGTIIFGIYEIISRNLKIN